MSLSHLPGFVDFSSLIFPTIFVSNSSENFNMQKKKESKCRKTESGNLAEISFEVSKIICKDASIINLKLNMFILANAGFLIYILQKQDIKQLWPMLQTVHSI